MELVIDAWIIFTALTGIGVTKKIIFLKNINLFSPSLLSGEITEHKERIVELSKLSSSEVEEVFELIKGRISFIPESSFKSFLNQANSLISDKEDTSYLALSLSKNIPIWSND